jgi:hypothetical protein
VTDRRWVDPSFKLTDDRFDASYTYDGYLIVSERFRSITDGPGVRFIGLLSDPGFYSLVVQNVVMFDAKRRQTIFEQPCGECGRFFVVAGATPVFLMASDPLCDQLFRTDIEFGTGNEQHPLIILGSGLAAQLREADLRGVDLSPVTGLDPP